MPGQKRLLDRGRRIRKAKALAVIIVEILADRAHAADVKRQFRLHRIAASLQIIAQPDLRIRRDVKIA